MISFHFYYLAPAPVGSDSNAGTINSPWLTLHKAYVASTAGDTIYMRDGDYNYTTEQVLYSNLPTIINGDSNNYIRFWNYPNEHPHIVFNVATRAYGTGIVFIGDYFWFKGIEISGYKQLSSSSGGSGFRMNDGGTTSLKT